MSAFNDQLDMLKFMEKKNEKKTETNFAYVFCKTTIYEFKETKSGNDHKKMKYRP